MKKLIILNHNGGRLANQLWNFVSIYAYCLEKKYECKNYCFFEYGLYYHKELSAPNLGVIFLVHFYKLLKKMLTARVARKIVRNLYRVYVKYVTLIHKDLIVDSDNISDRVDDFFPLPPSKESRGVLKMWEGDITVKSIFFTGWRFRNTLGLIKFHDKIVEIFRPREEYYLEVQSFINSLKKPGVKIVGVHVRHGDYKTWNNGKYFFTFQEVRNILDDYLKFANHENTLFVICSDDKIDESCFEGLSFVKGPGSEITDLYALATTDLIIGSKSTYGTFAAYYGDKPFYTFSRENINWEKGDDIYLI